MRWLAHTSLETGGAEVYVRPFQVLETGQRFLVSVPQDPGPAYASIRVVVNWPALVKK